jgi:hypothetical protein
METLRKQQTLCLIQPIISPHPSQSTTKDRTMTQPESIDFRDLFRRWAFDGIDSLSIVVGYAKLLIENEDKLGSLTERQRSMIKTIYHASAGALDKWRDPLDYFNFYDRRAIHQKWTPYPFSELVDGALLSLQDYEIGKIQSELPDSLPVLRGNRWLVYAIAYLIFPKTNSRLSDRLTTIKAQAVENAEVLIHITTEVDLDPYEKAQSENLFYPGSRLLTARKIIEELYQSPFKTQISDQKLEFEFTLPTWQLDADAPLEVNLSLANNGGSIGLRLGQDLIVTFPNYRLVETPDKIECDTEVINCTGSQWTPEILQDRFTPVKVGQTLLKIKYYPDPSREVEIFSVNVNVNV